MATSGCAGESALPGTRPAAAPTGDERPAAGTTGYDTVVLSLPRGATGAGRQAFVDLKCTACHRVTGEPDLPAPVSANPGPDLGAGLASRPSGVVATAIVAPSHAMSVDTSAEVRAGVTGVLSPMGDYSESMTVRQLLDLIAYLQSANQ